MEVFGNGKLMAQSILLAVLIGNLVNQVEMAVVVKCGKTLANLMMALVTQVMKDAEEN